MQEQQLQVRMSLLDRTTTAALDADNRCEDERVIQFAHKHSGRGQNPLFNSEIAGD